MVKEQAWKSRESRRGATEEVIDLFSSFPLLLFSSSSQSRKSPAHHLTARPNLSQT